MTNAYTGCYAAEKLVVSLIPTDKKEIAWGDGENAGNVCQ